jgi:hypothetical protein
VAALVVLAVVEAVPQTTLLVVMAEDLHKIQVLKVLSVMINVAVLAVPILVAAVEEDLGLLMILVVLVVAE